MLSVIDSYMEQILNHLENNNILNIISSTLTGKTTSLPLNFAKMDKRIIVSVFDDNVARSLTQYLSTQYSDFNVRFVNSVEHFNDILVSIEQTPSITYMSHKTLKNILYSYTSKKKKWDFVDILMIDEMNKQTLDISMILSLYSMNNKESIKLLLCSLPSPYPNSFLNNFPVKNFHIKTYDYPTTIVYHENYEPTSVDLMFDSINLIYDLFISSSNDILVFTSGKSQSDSMKENLEKMLKNYDVKIFSESLVENIDKSRKIFLNSSVFETYSYLKNVDIIIDMMIETRRSLTITGGERHIVDYITKEKAYLRSTRLNRDKQIECHRMISKELYEKLPNNRKNEIYRYPLHKIILELIFRKINPIKLSIFSTKKLKKEISLMIKLGVLDSSLKITKKGLFVQNSVFGLRNSSALWDWMISHPPFPAIAILSMIDCFNDYYVYPLMTKDQNRFEYNLKTLEHEKDYFSQFRGNSDIETFSNIINKMLNDINIDDINIDINNVEEWAINHSLSYKDMIHVIEIIKIMIKYVENYQPVEIGHFSNEGLISNLGPILVNNYGKKLTLVDDVLVVYEDKKKNKYTIDQIQSVNNINKIVPKTVYPLITKTIKSSYGDSNSIVCSLVL